MRASRVPEMKALFDTTPEPGGRLVFFFVRGLLRKSNAFFDAGIGEVAPQIVAHVKRPLPYTHTSLPFRQHRDSRSQSAAGSTADEARRKASSVTSASQGRAAARREAAGKR